MLVYQTKDDQNSFIKEHQHGGYDGKCIRPICVLLTTMHIAHHGDVILPTFSFFFFESTRDLSKSEVSAAMRA